MVITMMNISMVTATSSWTFNCSTTIITAEPTDSARYGDGWRKGYKNFPLISFSLYIGGSLTYMLILRWVYIMGH